MRVSGERKRERGREIEVNGAEQQRAARTRRPFAYFTGNLRASIRQGNCKNGGVIYLSLPPWALSSFPRFPPLSSTLLLSDVRERKLARPRKRSLPYYAQRVPCRSKKIPLSSPLCADKRDLSNRSELPRPPNCVIEITSRSVIRCQRIPASKSRSQRLPLHPPETRKCSYLSRAMALRNNQCNL